MASVAVSNVQKPAREDRSGAHPTFESYKKAGIALAKPLVDAVKREDPETLAKMVVIALAPQLLRSGLRFVGRHPVLAVAGLAGFSIWLGRNQQTAV